MIVGLRLKYTLVRVHRPHIVDNPYITMIFDQYEHRARDAFIELCIEKNLAIEVEHIPSKMH